ncbi:MAG: hypothetical protein IJ626_05175 [Muribaculaceae bacterium]|nr:hypothetical protein [Muribaculaceae bacterium]
MKKLLLMVVAVATISLVACTGKSEANQQQADSAATEQVAFDEQACVDGISSEIANVLETKDATKLQELLDAAKAKVQELAAQNPELAKSLLEKIQALLNENKEKLAAVIPGWDAIAEKAVALPAGLLDGAAAAGEELKDQAVDAANAKVEEAKDAAAAKANEAVDAAKAAADAKVEEAKQKANEAVDNAKAEAAKKLLGK